MALTILPAVLQAGMVLDAAQRPLYVAPALTKATIKRAVFTNIGTTSVTVTVTVTRGTAAALVIVNETPVGPPPAAALIPPELASLVLNPGDTLSASASTAAVINAFVSGMTVA